ncbi:MAG: hypothetical protein AAF907_15665 [Planctomycetota bacterium]
MNNNATAAERFMWNIGIGGTDRIAPVTARADRRSPILYTIHARRVKEH